MGAVLEPSFAFRDGRLRSERVGARVRTFELGDSRTRRAISVGGSEHLALPALYPALRRVDVLLGMPGAHVRAVPLATAAIAAAGTLPPVRAALRRALARRAKGSTGGPGEQARSRTGTTVLATAYAAGDRELGAVRLEGVNSYTFGFAMLAWAAETAATHGVGAPGALGPVAAFGLDELEAGVRAAGITRAAR
jgi:hypothetical protein